ncbi:hypothetical protein OHB31_18725 [Streptomyces microflavus]|uniref:hypothetical protein n=1 Tax=Streptomyces griseus group TaxID=629295 RepID=UPI002DDAD94A|nr:hypothetical protein [Streptomyces microflavus]WSA62069.1 hypothetical protein OHB31_18725 [Streptomyces microflavus]
MAAKSLELTELETILETGIRDRSVAFELLNMVRVENGKAALNGWSDCTTHAPAVFRPALTGLQADLNA